MLGLDGVKQIGARSTATPADHVGSIATLEVFGAGSGLTPSEKTLSFVQNHDTERNGDALELQGRRHQHAGHPVAARVGLRDPQVYSGFTWEAPSNPGDYTNNDDKTATARPARGRRRAT